MIWLKWSDVTRWSYAGCDLVWWFGRMNVLDFSCVFLLIFFFFFWEWCKQTRSIWAPTFLPFSVFSVAFIHLIFHWVDTSFLSDLSSTSDLLSVTIFFFFLFIISSFLLLICHVMLSRIQFQISQVHISHEQGFIPCFYFVSGNVCAPKLINYISILSGNKTLWS